jgi:hypothetical protein
MLKSLLLGCLALVAAGCATQSRTRPDTQAQTTPAGCTRDTGTRLPADKGTSRCDALGRSYSAEEIRNTGATDVGTALHFLDPSITVHH